MFRLISFLICILSTCHCTQHQDVKKLVVSSGEIFKGDNHSEELWSKRLHYPMTFVMGRDTLGKYGNR